MTQCKHTALRPHGRTLSASSVCATRRLCVSHVFRFRLAERNSVFDLAARIENANLTCKCAPASDWSSATRYRFNAFTDDMDCADLPLTILFHPNVCPAQVQPIRLSGRVGVVVGLWRLLESSVGTKNTCYKPQAPRNQSTPSVVCFS